MLHPQGHDKVGGLDVDDLGRSSFLVFVYVTIMISQVVRYSTHQQTHKVF